jgi:hypothetical protein
MTYFSTTYRAEVAGHETQSAYDKLFTLHRALHERIRSNHWDIHPHHQKTNIISSCSAAGYTTSDVLTLSYFRSADQAMLVENMMGIDDKPNHVARFDPHRHPIIELRLGQDHFAIELILSPKAWLDQQNLIGKLELDRHRTTLRDLLRRMTNDYCFGFWDGSHLNDMHLTTWQLTHSKVMNEWMGTFAEGQDWLRFGAWYHPDDTALAEGNIVHEAIRRMSDLYNLYEFILWTSNNNYRSFHEKRERFSRRMMN